ncbi:putative FAD dependent oxidoreductase [Neofusicoccum parvum]|nr:putative FAD dependent oxidoreductase [Neofusicoccum parvum]
MKALSLSEDRSLVTIGPGNDWDAVYSFLQPYDLTTVGARLGLVGVSGHLLGGGMTYLSNEHGFSSTSVVEYECVLANGTIISATSTSHPDLHWSLRSGGNSFALITAFHMRTIPTGPIYAGFGTYDSSQTANWITTVHSQALYGDADTAGGVEATATWNPSAGADDLSYTSYLFYHGDEAQPAILANWTGALLTPTNPQPLNRTTVAAFSRSLYGGVPQNLGARTRFAVLGVSAARGGEAAVAAVHDGFFDAARAQLAGVRGVMAGLVALPVGKRFVEANGGAQHVTGAEAGQAPWIWIIQTYTWSDAADDTVVEGFAERWAGEMGARLEAEGWAEGGLYLNDAERWQNVFASYGEGNLRRLKEVREEYDPEMVFTRLMPGGWKVADA